MPFVLSTPDGKNSHQQTLQLGFKPLKLQLQVENNAELTAKTGLTLKAVPDVEEITTGILSCNLGEFDNTKTIRWLMVDWGDEKPLAQIHFKTSDANCKGRVKIFTNGYWQALNPIEVIAQNDAPQPIAPVFAGKLMIELVSAGMYPGLWEPSPAQVTQFGLYADTAPADLELALADARSVFKQNGLLSSSGWKVLGFNEAVNAFIKQNPRADNIDLQLTAKTPGKFAVQFTPDAQTLIDQTATPLTLQWRNAQTSGAETVFKLKTHARLSEIGFTLDYRPTPEKLWFDYLDAHQGKAQFVDPQSRIAQSFLSDDDGMTLTGFDIQLTKRSDGLQATLALHPDQHGYPAEQPYGGATFPIDDHSAWQQDWLQITLLKPLRLTDKKWWLVLTAQNGEAFWRLSPKNADRIGPALFRKAPNGWLTIDDALQLQSRIRVLDPSDKYLTEMQVTRGAVTQTLPLKKTNDSEPAAYQLFAELEALNQADEADLIFKFEAQAPGALGITQLRIAYTGG